MVPWAEVPTRVPAILEQMQKDLLASARARYDACLEKVGGAGATGVMGAACCAPLHMWGLATTSPMGHGLSPGRRSGL